MLNITTGAIILSVATIPELLALLMSLRGYWTRKYRYYLYMSFTWLFIFMANVLLAISYLYIDTTLYRIAIIINAPITFSMMFLVDSVSRKKVDPVKVLITSIVSTSLVIFAFEPGAVVINTSYLGEKAPAMAGDFDLAGSMLFALAGLFWLYYMVKIYLSAPDNLKKDSTINLLGALIAGPGSGIAFASGFVWYLPGTDYICIAIGALTCAYAFTKQPKLGYVLSFKVYRLMTINSNSGITLFSYDWIKDQPLDNQLFSAALTGICSILNESLGKGIIREIEFEQGILILQQIENYPIFFVLIANESRPILKNALQLFSKGFSGEFSIDLVENNIELSRYDVSDSILKETFPFVVEYS